MKLLKFLIYITFFSETPTPMSQRQLPQSFWQLPETNVNGSNNSTTSASTTSVSTASYADFYSDQLQQAAALHAAAAAVDWPYQTAHSAQSGYVNRSASHPYNYTRFHQPASAAAGTGYWAAASRLAASQVKGEWAGEYQAAAAALQGATGLHNAAAGDFSHHYGAAAAAAAHHYTTGITGKYINVLN